MNRPIRILGERLIRQLATPDRLRLWCRQALIASHEGRAVQPLRQGLVLPDDRGVLGMMPGHLLDASAAGIKLVALVPPHRRKGGSHNGLMVLFDDDGLQPIAIACASTITAIRTAAVTAVATDELARADAKHLGILGTGEQAQAHLDSLRDIRPWDSILIWGRDAAKASALAQSAAAKGLPAQARESLETVIERSDVLCTVTASTSPFLMGQRLRPGQHVNLVGSSHAKAQEADAEVVFRSRFFVDLRASAWAQAAELLQAQALNPRQNEGWIEAEIGAVLSGQHPGRQSPEDLTVYKSLGIASQDLMTARGIFDLAEAEQLGALVDLS